MRVFITGATGFIGQHLLNVLKNRDYHITILSSRTSPEFWSGCRIAEIVKGDLGSIRDWKTVLKNQDAVIHLASELRNEQMMDVVNCQGAADLAEAALEAGVKTFIHLSSVGVVGRQFSGIPISITEESPCDPQNKYEKTKWEGEKRIKAILQNKSRLVIFRPTNVYGDHNNRNVLLGLIRKIREGMAIPHSGNAILNYVYAGDLAGAIAHALKVQDINGVFIIGTSTPARMFLQEIASCLKVELRSRTLPGSVLRGIAFFAGPEMKGKLFALCNRVRYEDKKWKGIVGNAYSNNTEGLRKTIEWYRLNQQIQ